MLTGAANHVLIRHLIGRTWGYQKFKTSVNRNSKKKVWQWQKRFGKFFMGATHILSPAAHPTTIFLGIGAQFERELNRLSNGIRCQKALLPQKNNLLNTNVLTFCAKFLC